MHDSPPHSLPQSVLAYLRQRRWLKPGDRVGVAVSGGADSVALLRALLELRGELGIALSVVHFNHLLRGEESEGDHSFVRELARERGLELQEARGDVARRAEEFSLSTEAAAREARYECFWGLMETSQLDKIATAHTLDDQAETVLMRLIRGTGTRGLGGIQPQLSGPALDRSNDRSADWPASRQVSGTIIRPLLHVRRREVETYLRAIGQKWREDSSNRDLHHTRNRVRKLLIPLLEKDFNPEIAQSLSDFAEIARAEESFWEEELQRHLQSGFLLSPLKTKALLQLPLALQRRLVRAAAPLNLQLEFRQVEAILQVAESEQSPTVCNLAHGWTFQRRGEDLLYVPPTELDNSGESCNSAIFSALRLPVPGQTAVPGTGRIFQAVRILRANPPAGYNPEHLYAPHALPSELVVRTWQFGDRFWPAHTKAPKKLKELFPAKKIPAELRATWPVMVAEQDGREEVVWVQGFAAPAHLRPGPGDSEAILLLENPPRENARKSNGV
jgi:tRNA(Ile)-lysidine synthase